MQGSKVTLLGGAGSLSVTPLSPSARKPLPLSLERRQVHSLSVSALLRALGHGKPSLSVSRSRRIHRSSEVEPTPEGWCWSLLPSEL